MKDPLISIVVPVYNTEKYLNDCIESIINQTYANLEIFLIDDGSTDSSGIICDQWKSKDKRIKVIHQTNQGAACAKNTGLNLIQGNFCEIVDSDDILRKDIIERQYNLLVQHNVDIVESNLLKFYDLSEISDQSRDTLEIIEYSSEAALAELMLNRNLHQTPVCKLYKTYLLTNIRFVPGTYIDDEFWTYKVFGESSKILKYNIVGYYYRQHNNSAMGRPYSINRIVILDAFEQRLIYMRKHYPNLETIAWKTYLGSCIYHFQKLCKYRDADVKKINRKKIIKKYKFYYDSFTKKHLLIKEHIRFCVFRYAPVIYSVIFNLANKGN